jgi:hypothetical protein
MKGKIALVVGGAAGYVLGARAGRERYEQIVRQAKALWENPQVQEAASRAPGQAQKVAATATSKLGGQLGAQHRGSGVTPPKDTYPNADAPLDDLGP